MPEGATSLKPTSVSTRRTTCRACGGLLGEVLNLGVQYLVRFVSQKELELPQPASPLELCLCNDCNLLQLRHTVQPNLLFSEFHYRSSINETMKTALNDVVQDGMRYAGMGAWLDIGANDGWLLKQVPKAFTKFAVEPALNFRDELEGIANVVISDYYGVLPEKFDVITSIAMFYDVEDPDAFVRRISRNLKPNGVWINQLNDAPTMLKRNAFDAICHEHLCYYDVHTLDALYRRHGLRIVSVKSNDVNGGSIRVAAQKDSSGMSLAHIPRTNSDDVSWFARRVHSWKSMAQHVVEMLSKDFGPLYGYGASTKGSVLLQYLQMNEHFAAIADRNQRKWGKKMPGVEIPIIGETEFRDAGPRSVMVLPWAFRSEFLERESHIRKEGTRFLFPLPTLDLVP